MTSTKEQPPFTEPGRYPADMETWRSFKGRRLFARPLRITDAERLLTFFHTHNPDTIYGRYQYAKKTMPPEEAVRLCTLDYRETFALGVFRGDGEDDPLVAIGRYIRNEAGYAETALVVHEDFRRRGIASWLLERMRFHATRSGIIGFYGEFAPGNAGIVALHRKLGHYVMLDDDAGAYGYVQTFGKVEKGRA
jgi:GNAT superfamily N-acetyltransferase